MSSAHIRTDFAESFEGGFKVVDDLLSENVGIGKIVGLFEAFISEPEDVEAFSRSKTSLSPFRIEPTEI